MAIVTASGIASGTGTLSSSLQIILHVASGTASGVNSLFLNNILDGGGTAVGSSSISGRPKVTHNLSGLLVGRSSLIDHAPLPIFGIGVLTGFAEVVRIPPPVSCELLRTHRSFDCRETDCGVCHWIRMLPPWIPRDRAHISMFLGPTGQALFADHCRCFDHGRDALSIPFHHDVVNVPCPPKKFRWGHTFVFGDLVLNISTSSGKASTPYSVTWTMFRSIPGGSLIQAGPTQRAVQQKVGLFYATGTAGENGQPGDWVIRWTYVRSFGGSETSVDELFRVVDAVACPIPGDTTCRAQKYGWD